MVYNSMLLLKLVKADVHTTNNNKSQQELWKDPNESPVVVEKCIFKKNSYANDMFWKLSHHGPAFLVNADHIDFLQEPKDFYQELLVWILFLSLFVCEIVCLCRCVCVVWLCVFMQCVVV
jgi:hypothetical protein